MYYTIHIETFHLLDLKIQYCFLQVFFEKMSKEILVNQTFIVKTKKITNIGDILLSPLCLRHFHYTIQQSRQNRVYWGKGDKCPTRFCQKQKQKLPIILCSPEFQTIRRKSLNQTSSKGFSASRCDVEKSDIFKIRNFLGVFGNF